MSLSVRFRLVLLVPLAVSVIVAAGCPATDGGGTSDGNENVNDNGNENVNDNTDDNANENDNGTGEDDDTSQLGEWANALGGYLFVGNCPGSDGWVTLVQVGPALVLQGLEENPDISLTLDGPTATAGDVVAFTIGGHDLTMVLEGGLIVFSLVQPDLGGFCDAIMTPLDRDCFQSTGRGTVTLDVEDTDCANGVELDLASAGFDTAVVELDPAPYTTGTDIQTELVQLELAADLGGTFGQVVIRERDDKRSTGRIQNVVADDNGDFVSGDSFFDVFIEVGIAGMDLSLDTAETPFRLDAGTITELPPLSSDYLPPPSAPPVELYIAGTSTQVGWFCHAQHTPTEVVPCEER